MGKCNYKYHEMFPNYGLAPHKHDLSSGSFIGSTRVEPEEKWPKNFIEDPGCKGCGVYYCPECLEGLPENEAALLGFEAGGGK